MIKPALLFLSTFLLLILFTGIAKAEPGKRIYWLGNPTPRDSMRDFQLDRPDVTESPYSVDAGHFQLETDLVKFTRTGGKLSESKTWLYNAANLKLGITNSSDFQVVVEMYKYETETSAAGMEVSKGVGSVTLRWKQNVFGNDGGKWAVGLLPFVTLPKNGSKASGGLAVPVAGDLGGGWSFGSMVQAGFVPKSSGSGYETELLATATVGHEIVRNLEFFVESYVTYLPASSVAQPFLNGGLVYSIGKNVKVDAGYFHGFRDEAGRSVFLGLSLRY